MNLHEVAGREMDYYAIVNKQTKLQNTSSMLMCLANRNCSPVYRLTIKMLSYKSTADFEMPHH
jgi:hypothetical protein